VRTQAATWVAGQLSSAETVGCDPLMCAALRAHGVAASRLMPSGSTGPGAAGAGVVVASASADGQQDAPVLLASFGSGPSLVEVRTAPPGGSAAYQRAVAELPPARRQDAGVQAVRWMIEELRVSLFAQVLGTSGPISEKRILAALDRLAGPR